MCLGIPGEVIEFMTGHDDLVKVDVGGVRRVISAGLLGDGEVGIGDWVLVHVGFAMAKIDQAEAAATLELLSGLGQAYTDELAALAESDI